MAALVKSAASPKMFRRNYKRMLRQQHGQTSMSGKSAVCEFEHGAAKGCFLKRGFVQSSWTTLKSFQNVTLKPFHIQNITKGH
jgi:hypothetical protein